MTTPLRGLGCVVCGDGGASRAHAPPKLQGAVCGLCAPSVRPSRTKMCRRSSRSILVLDKGRGSQASLLPVTPSRKAGRRKGLRTFRGGVLGENPASPLKSRSSEVHPRGSPRGYWPVFEPISALSEIVNVLITKRSSCGYFLFL